MVLIITSVHMLHFYHFAANSFKCEWFSGVLSEWYKSESLCWRNKHDQKKIDIKINYQCKF